MSADAAQSGFDRQATGGRQDTQRLLTLIGLFATVLVLAGIVYLPGEEHHDTGPPNARRLTSVLFPVEEIETISSPGRDESFNLPAAVVPIGSELAVLDTGQVRILILGAERDIVATFDAESGEQLELELPLAMARDADGTKLYVANSLRSEIVVVDTMTGATDRRIQFERLDSSDEDPRIIGLTLTPDGGMAVSDADNHRVLILDGSGKVVATAGAGHREAGEKGFNVPGAITADQDGNLYVVDTLNSRVVKLSSDGSYLMDFGTRGTTVGTLARPKGIAVDPAGHVFVSDAITASVAVFDADGQYIGLIGRSDPDDVDSPSLFRAPAALWYQDDRLYVADRVAGVVILRLGKYSPPPSPSESALGSEFDSGSHK